MLAGATKIALRATLLVGVLALVWLSALLVGRPVGITFAQGTFTFTIDSQATYNGVAVPSATWDLKNLVPGVDKFFNFSDIKPGDSGENTISLHTSENAWVCLAFQNLTQAENGENEPESQVDNTPGGDLAAGTEVFAWRDDGDNIFEPQSGETVLIPLGTALQRFATTTYAIADATHLPMILGNQTRYFGIQWCAGDLTVNMQNGAMTCNGEAMGNETQTDSFSVDVSLTAVSAVEQPQFTCDGIPPPPPPTERPMGLGEQIGLFVKCQNIAQVGWPLPKYKTECPNGFGRNNPPTQTQSVAPQPTPAPEPRSDRTRPPR